MSIVINGISYVPKFRLPPSWDSLGELLKRTRKEAGLSLSEAANTIQCSKSNLYELERDRSQPSFRLAIQISLAYDLPLMRMASAMQLDNRGMSGECQTISGAASCKGKPRRTA